MAKGKGKGKGCEGGMKGGKTHTMPDGSKMSGPMKGGKKGK